MFASLDTKTNRTFEARLSFKPRGFLHQHICSHKRVAHYNNIFKLQTLTSRRSRWKTEWILEWKQGVNIKGSVPSSLGFSSRTHTNFSTILSCPAHIYNILYDSVCATLQIIPLFSFTLISYFRDNNIAYASPNAVIFYETCKTYYTALLFSIFAKLHSLRNLLNEVDFEEMTIRCMSTTYDNGCQIVKLLFETLYFLVEPQGRKFVPYQQTL